MNKLDAALPEQARRRAAWLHAQPIGFLDAGPIDEIRVRQRRCRQVWLELAVVAQPGLTRAALRDDALM
jgi:hypothetical protein